MRIERLLCDHYGMKPDLLRKKSIKHLIGGGVGKPAITSTLEAILPHFKPTKDFITKKIMQFDDKRTKKTSLEYFMKTYNYYIHKLLWSSADPFLKKKLN